MNYSIDSRHKTSAAGKLLGGIFIIGSLGVLGYGIWCLFESQEDRRSTEENEFNDIVSAWQDEHIGTFDDLNVTVQARGGPLVPLHESDMMDKQVKEDGFEEYDPLKYFVKAQLFSNDLKDYYNITSDIDIAYNYTAPITLSIDSSEIFLNATVFKKKHFNLNQKMCINHMEGVWEAETHRCYYYYALSSLNVIVEQVNATWRVAEDYEEAVSEDWEVVVKRQSGAKFHPLEDQAKVALSIRSIHDPYLAYDESEIDPTSNQLLIGGIVCICIAVLVQVLTWCYLCRRQRTALKELSGPDDYNLPSLTPVRD